MANNKLDCPKWTRDIHENELHTIDFVTNRIYEILRWNWYQRIETPVFEYSEIFKRSWYFNPDKCYVFNDKWGREMVLRTDINAPLSRSLINNSQFYKNPVKLFFCDKVYRYRNGKKREFKMCWIELYWSNSFFSEIDIIITMSKIVKEVWFSEITVQFNNLKLIYELLWIIFIKNNIPNNKVNEFIYKLRHESSQTCINILIEMGISDIDIELIISIIKNEENSFILLEKIIEIYPQLESIKNEIYIFYELLKNLWINSYFKISELHWSWFYDWLTYKLFVDDIENELWDWWRYNNMTNLLWWKQIPATWIWFWIERLIRFMKLKNIEISNTNKKVLFFTRDEEVKLSFYKDLNNSTFNGYTIELDFENDKESKVIKYAESKKYDYVIFINNLNWIRSYKVINLKSNTNFVKQYTTLRIDEILSVCNNF